MATIVSEVTVGTSDAPLLARAPRSLWSDARRRLLRNKAAVAGIVYIAALALIALGAPLLAPHNPLKIFPSNGYRQAAWIDIAGRPDVTGVWEFPLGTDAVGRDTLSRLIYGSRTSLVVGLIPMAITLLVGALVGLISGFRGGVVDALLMRMADVVNSFPALLFFIIVMTALKDTPVGRFLNGFLVLFAALSLVGWVGVARLVRGQVLSIKEKEFIEAARAVGARTPGIMLRHVLPNSLGPIIVAGAFIVPGTIIAEAVLSFLGLGVQPPAPSWGTMLNAAQQFLESAPWMAVWPGAAIFVLALSFNLAGDGLRDLLDPRDY
jgi:oligopeptide transport system permease protein